MTIRIGPNQRFNSDLDRFEYWSESQAMWCPIKVHADGFFRKYPTLLQARNNVYNETWCEPYLGM